MGEGDAVGLSDEIGAPDLGSPDDDTAPEGTTPPDDTTLDGDTTGDEELPAVDPHTDHVEELPEEIEELVTITVEADDEVKYYVRPGETFIVEVHIANPDDFEIQSFTLNGKKYANYMFKDGSTMELLLLEVTAPATSGYTSYSIDAIKYIDGTEIKDVDMICSRGPARRGPRMCSRISTDASTS